jgi:hypothetical protein
MKLSPCNHPGRAWVVRVGESLSHIWVHKVAASTGPCHTMLLNKQKNGASWGPNKCTAYRIGTEGAGQAWCHVDNTRSIHGRAAAMQCIPNPLTLASGCAGRRS